MPAHKPDNFGQLLRDDRLRDPRTAVMVKPCPLCPEAKAILPPSRHALRPR
jgi:hypothetical protein